MIGQVGALRHGPLRALRHDDTGSAVVEFVTIGILLLIPVVYLVLTLGRMQAATFAVEGAARESARVLAAAPEPEVAGPQVDAVVALAIQDQGFDSDGQPDPVVTVSCSATPCSEPETEVLVEVAIEVSLPGVPAFLDAAIPTRIDVSAQGRAVVERFAEPGAGLAGGDRP